MFIRKQSIRFIIVAALFSLVLFGSGSFMPAPKPAQAAPPGFAYRCGVHFCLDGKFFYFAGANSYDIFTLGGSWGDIETTYMDKAATDAHFARMQADGIAVVRLWMFSHEDWHGFEPQEGVFNESQWSLFDYVIESAKSHNIKLIPVFENYWEAYGGIDKRLSWEGLTGGHPGRAKFFNKTVCPGCNTQYKNMVNYALNRINHYSGIAYKNEPTIFAWELMNEPRYQGVSAAEDASGATLRAWVDEMGAYIKGIDPNHMLGTGLEAHESRFGFGGNEGNPFIYIHQSPYIDFTSAHPYFDEPWANLTIAQGRAIVKQWIEESHNIIGKPFFMGEFNMHNNVTQWWDALLGEIEASDGDGSAFWHYAARNIGTTFDVNSSSPQMPRFRQHAAFMRAKNGTVGPTPTRSSATRTNTPTRTATQIVPTNTPTRVPTTVSRTNTPTRVPTTVSRTNTPTRVPTTVSRTNTPTRVPATVSRTNTPTRVPTTSVPPTSGPSSLKVQYRAADTNAADNQIKPHFNIVNTGSASVNMSELKIRYYFTKDAGGTMVFNCDWAVKGCGNLSGAFVAATGTNTDTYLEVSFTTGAGSIAAGQSSGEMQIRLNKSDWTNFNESNDYSFDPTKTAFADWTRAVLLRNGTIVWGTAP